MGAWGITTFENDGAMDWLTNFLDDPSEDGIWNAFPSEPIVIEPGFLGRLMGKKPKSLPEEVDGEEVLAAAEIVATVLGRPAKTNPDELKTLPTIQLRQSTVAKALAAIDAMMKDSNLKECWEETDEFEAWKAGVADLQQRLSTQ